MKDSIQFITSAKETATKKKSAVWTFIEDYSSKIKNAIFDQFKFFLYALLVSFVVMDVVAFILWFNNSGSLEETINGTQLFLLVFILPFAISFISASAGASGKNKSQVQTPQIIFVGLIFCLSYWLCIIFISHWSQDWMDVFIELYGNPFYFLSIALLPIISFTIAFGIQSTAPASIFAVSTIGSTPILIGSAVLLTFSGSVSPLAWQRSTEILNNMWIRCTNFGLFIYCLSGCVAFFLCERHLQQEVRKTEFGFSIPKLLVYWPVLIYSAFQVGIFIMIILRYRTIMTLVRSGYGVLM